jgi:Stress responsive A/B Barrel Domain
MHRSLGKLALALTTAIAILQITARADDGAQPPKMGQPPYVHSVVFYLKKDTPPAKVEAMIADCHTILGKIPTVRGLWAGRPADKATPDRAIKDYQVGLVVLFDNYDGLKTYLDYPTHLKLVETYSPFFDKVLVYDFENQTK